jgi:hypothetical protein
MSVRIDVVNFALGILGEGEITSIEDDSDKARVMKTFYYISRDATLEDGEWTFAAKRFIPARNIVPPAFGWNYAFTIPSDIIRVTLVIKNPDAYAVISDIENDRNAAEHIVEGNEILCDEEVIYCKGVRRMEDEGGYSPLFAEAFAAKLAYLAALPLTSSNQKMQVALGLYEARIKRARTRDGQQNTTRRLRNKTLARAR